MEYKDLPDTLRGGLELKVIYPYHTANGDIAYEVRRFESPVGEKSFQFVTPYPGGSCVPRLEAERVLFHLRELLAAPPDAPVIMTEGEKAALAAREALWKANISWPVTTTSGGAHSADKTPLDALKGRRVVILPDNDPDGEEYAATIIQKARAGGALQVVPLYLDGLPPKGDVVEWLSAGHDGSELARLAHEALRQAATEVEDASAVLAPEVGRFPVDALPKRLRQYVLEAAAATSCAVEYVAAPALAAAASAIGSTHELELKSGWCVQPVLWIAVVGPTGSAKSPAQQKALIPLEREQRRLDHEYDADMAAYEDSQQYDNDKSSRTRLPTRRQVKTTDSTVEALAELLQVNSRGLLMARDELSALTNGMNQYRGGKGADREFYLSAWAGASSLINRRNRSISLGRVCLSIVGALPPDILVTLNNEKGREDGFVHRFLFTWPAPVKHRWSDMIIDPRVEEDYIDLFHRLFQLQHQPSDTPGERGEPWRLRLSAGAKVLFAGYYNKVQTQAESTEIPVAMRGALTKMPVHTARLALVIHVCRLESGETASEDVDSDSMSAAIALADYFVEADRCVYAHLATRPEDARIVKFLDWMREHGLTHVTRRELVHARVAGIASAREADEFLADLVELGLGIRSEEEARGGRRITFRLQSSQAFDTVDSIDSSTESCDL